MRTVRHEDGTLYVLLKESADSSLVRDPATGDTTHLPNEALEPAGGESPLDALATGISAPARAVVRACHEDWHLGLLLDLAARGPLPARELLGTVDVCESDLVGALSELRAAGLVAETTVGGERGYELTETGSAGVEALRE